jgi:2-methylisocitrate lyase-like PEP mutase family enzyme
MPTVAEKRRVMRTLHEAGCFVMPNPWDIGSARYLQGLGFKALATTSAGAGWSMGYADGQAPLDEMLGHIRMIAAACDVPVNADFVAGFAVEPDDVAVNVRKCVDTRVAALSIEDARADGSLFDFELSVARVRAAKAAAGDAMLVARTEVYFTDHPKPLDEAIRRLKAFSEAGADCLYAPAPKTREDISALVQAVAPKPLNVLARELRGLAVADLAAMGVRRISVGGLMARTAWTGFIRGAEGLAAGNFDDFEGAISGVPLNAFFASDTPRRPQ